MISPIFEKLVQGFNNFPGIGKKTAQRLAWYLVSIEKNRAIEFANIIKETVENFKVCPNCQMLSETSPCLLCTDLNRSNNQLCIVETSSDIAIIENMHEYDGRYFVLGHLLSPIEGFGPNHLHIDQLLQQIQKFNPNEIIIALKPSAEGEATMHFLSELLKSNELILTRLSTGIPFGGELEYSSSVTLANAWKRRYSI